MELSYQDYLKQVAHVLNEETNGKVASQVNTLGKFEKSAHGQWVPVSYEGFSLITPTFTDDSENADCYREIDHIRQEIREKDFPQFVAVPVSAFHMTVARLISGEVFAKKIRNNDGHENELLSVLIQVLSEINIDMPLKFEIKGFSLFPDGVIAAIVSPVTADDYRYLQAFRDHIYSDQVLADLGVERRRNFCGHISLYYIEQDLSGNEKAMLTEILQNINRRFFQSPLPYRITRAEVRKFENFLKFYRNDNWPIYRFGI